MTALDKRTRDQLREVYDMVSSGSGCSFWACPGPDTYRITPMATCRNCAAAIMLRRILKRLGIPCQTV